MILFSLQLTIDTQFSTNMIGIWDVIIYNIQYSNIIKHNRVTV